MSEPSPLESQSSTLLCETGGAHENQKEIASKFWSRSLRNLEKHDKELVETWKGDADGILIFTGLFSSTVAGFIIESYKLLQRDLGDATVQILSQMSGQLAAISNGTVASVPSPSPPFRPSAGSIRVNALWFLSLCLSLTCALVATLMQQWSRNYLQMAHAQSSKPATQARIRAFAFDGVSKYQMSHALELVPLLLHISVFLFFLGMIEFLFPINSTVMFVVLGFVIAVVCAYLLLTIFPFSCPNFPYSTPLSPLVWRLSGSFTDLSTRVLSTLYWLTLTIIRLCSAYNWDMRHWQEARDDTFFMFPVYQQFRVGLTKRFVSHAVHADASVLGKQLVRELDSDSTEDVDEIEAFFDGMHATLVVDEAFSPVAKFVFEFKFEHKMLLPFRLQCLFDSCDSMLPEPTRQRRALVGVRAVWDIFSLKSEDLQLRLLLGAPFKSASAESWFLAMVPLLRHEERTVAVAARCIQAIVASNAVTKRDMGDLNILTSLVNPPQGLDHAVRDVDTLRANGGLLILVNLLADLATPLRASDALSPQVARIVGEVVPWLFPPWYLRGRVVPAVRDALVDARAFVCALADGQAQGNEQLRIDSTRRTTAAAANQRPGAFSKLAEEVCALVDFVVDEPRHV